ncbi:carbonic anhydrase [bacterium]|nr:carbonic anhydrase [bacterium]
MQTADEALNLLTEGNIRFADEKPIYPNLTAERRSDTLEHGQAPFVGILSCSDSRAPVELVFDRGIGDIFSVRNAGNICNYTVLGSFELCVYKFETPLLIVMGHTDCGAIKLAVKRADLPGNIPNVIDRIVPVVESVMEGQPDLSGDQLILEVTKANARQAMEELLSRSEMLREGVEKGNLRIIAAMHDLESGRVEWLE